MPKPNKENIITAILEQLAGNTTYTDCHKVILSKFKLSEPTFSTYWKIANERHLETQNAVQKAINDLTIDNDIKAVKNGLKTKTQYVAEIQKMLDDDIHEESVLDLKTGKVIRYHRKLHPLERKALYDRISKFEGMDAPAKTSAVNPDGTPQSKQIFIINGKEIEL